MGHHVSNVREGTGPRRLACVGVDGDPLALNDNQRMAWRAYWLGDDGEPLSSREAHVERTALNSIETSVACPHCGGTGKTTPAVPAEGLS